MGLKANFTIKDIEKRVLKFIQTVEKQIIKRLQYLGEQCVIHAIENRQYTDQSSNLKASTGYMVFKDGIAIHEGYKYEGDGTEIGKSLAKRVASKYNNGFLLVVTAGMNYAVHVESKGRNVLTATELYATREMPKMLEQLKSNINKSLE